VHPQYQVVPLDAPAAGQGFTFPIGGAVEVEVLSAAFTFTAAAAVANRRPFIEFVDTFGNTFYRAAPSVTIAATFATVVSFGVGTNEYGTASGPSMGVPIPALRLYNGLAVIGGADAIQGADTFTNIVLYVRQWPVRDD